MRNNKNIYFVISGLFATMIFVMTRFVQIPTMIGYIHPGDALIYLASAFLPTPYAMLASGVGGALADLSSGYVVYVPITILVKVMLSLSFSHRGEKLLSPRNIIASAVGIIITVGGYFAFEIFYYGAGAYATIVPNFIQGTASGIIFFVLAFALDRGHFKSKLDISNH